MRSSVLKITKNMFGDNMWECTVTSDYTPIPFKITAEFRGGQWLTYVVLRIYLII